MSLELLRPDWQAPSHVGALMSTRAGGVSTGAYASLNLGDHVGDAASAVTQNRARLAQCMPAKPRWLKQVHGVAVVDAAQVADGASADAAFCRQPGIACTIMTADCLPVLLCDRAGTVVAAAHAGWRGLCEGVLERTVTAMGVPPQGILAWLGAAIGPQAFEVGEEVRAAFTAVDGEAVKAFVRGAAPDKWMADLYLLARQRLVRAGVRSVAGGQWCTHADPARFFSYRRDGVTGRMAAMIWLGAPQGGVLRT
jgi:YfiH family protein